MRRTVCGLTRSLFCNQTVEGGNPQTATSGVSSCSADTALICKPANQAYHTRP